MEFIRTSGRAMVCKKTGKVLSYSAPRYSNIDGYYDCFRDITLNKEKIDSVIVFGRKLMSKENIKLEELQKEESIEMQKDMLTRASITEAIKRTDEIAKMLQD